MVEFLLLIQGVPGSNPGRGAMNTTKMESILNE